MDWSPVISWFSEHGWRILLIIAMAFALYYVMRHFVPIALKRTLKRTMKKRPKTAIQKRTDTLSAVFIEFGVVIIIIVTAFTILDEIGVSIAPALAGMGIVGIAVGFGAQNLVKDFFNGLLILLENQYGVGDYIEVAGVGGVVQEIGLRRTVLRDLNGTVHSIPNGEIAIASNFTKEWARVNMNIAVGYGEDLERVIEVINRVGKELAEDPKWAPVIMTMPQVLRVDVLGDSGIEIRILGETKPMEQWAVMGQLRLRLKKAFDEEGIEIPWPHTKVFFGNSPVEIDARETAKKKLTTPSMSQSSKPRRRRKALTGPEADD